MMEDRDGLFVIRTFANELDARLAESVLDANGIESIVVTDDASGWMTYFNLRHPVRLMVKEPDVETALTLLAD